MYRIETNAVGEKTYVFWDEQDPLADMNEQRFTEKELLFRAKTNFHIESWESEEDLLNQIDILIVNFYRQSRNREWEPGDTLPMDHCMGYDQTRMLIADVFAVSKDVEPGWRPGDSIPFSHVMDMDDVTTSMLEAVRDCGEY